MCKIDLKEDGLKYAYRHRLSARTELGHWKTINTHYDRKAIIDLWESELQYADMIHNGLVVEEFFEGEWVVDTRWLQEHNDNNRFRLTWEKTEI